jgi:hypothetical protein
MNTPGARPTPFLGEPGNSDPVLANAGFLVAREAELQARLAAVDAELAGLADAPDDLAVLEQQAADWLGTLLGLLDRPDLETRTALTPTPQPERPLSLPAAAAPRRQRRAGLILAGLALAAVLLATAGYLFWQNSRALPTRRETATATMEAMISNTAALVATLPATVSPMPTPPTATPPPSPIPAAPIVLGRAEQAETVRIASAAGDLRLELPLATMTETIQLAGDIPVLQPVAPASGAGLHRGSAPFGQEGPISILVPAAVAPPGLWQTRPGDVLTGCNTDQACYDYRITTAETWPLDRLHRALQDRPAGPDVLLYTIHESEAWVVQAQLQQEEPR